MAAKKKAAKAGAGAMSVGQSARSNDYVQRLIEDSDLRDNLRDAYESAQKAAERMSRGKSPTKVLMDDRRFQRELRDAASSLRDAADSLRGAKEKRRRKRKAMLMGVAVVGGAAALMASGGVRSKILDALFGAEEEFEYTSTTVPPAPTEPVGTAGTSTG
jgi:hypothetical protein